MANCQTEALGEQKNLTDKQVRAAVERNPELIRVVLLPPHTLRVTTLGRMACSARQFVASRPGQFRASRSRNR
jgi:hypothetical protein